MRKESIYLDLWEYYDESFPFQVFIGAYGAGKSFSALKGAIEREINFMYMRRTKEAFDACCATPKGDMGNPFNPINDFTGLDIGLHKQGQKLAGIYERERDKNGLPQPKGSPKGSATYLGALAKVRGAGLERTKLIIYDEFIKEMHEPKMRGEFKALMRGYETINRNKEMRGEAATQLWMISNAEDIYNPIFIGLGIVADCEKMARKGQEHKYYKDKGLAIHLLKSNPEFMKRKSETAIMRLMSGTQFADVGLKNKFANNDFSLVGYKRLTGWQPVCHLDFAYIYKKKGEAKWYVSYAEAKCAGFSANMAQDERLFRQRNALVLQDAFTEGVLDFESYELKEFILEHIF